MSADELYKALKAIEQAEAAKREELITELVKRLTEYPNAN